MATDSAINWVSSGAFASMPAAGVAGRIYLATDAPVTEWHDTGSAWVPFIMDMVEGVRPPTASNFTGVNGGSIADKNGALRVTTASDGTVVNTHPFVKSLTNVNTAYAEVAIALAGSYSASGTTFPGGGITLRESSSGKQASLSFFNNGLNANFLVVQAETWLSSTSGTSSPAFQVNGAPNAPLFLCVRRSGTNILWQLSNDRVTWNTIRTQSTSSIFTSAPDQCGVYGYGYNGPYVFDVIHFTSGT